MSRRFKLGSWRALLGALAAMLVSCAAAAAQATPRFEFDAPPRAVSIPTSEPLSYRLVILGGDQPARIRINARASTRFGDEHNRPEGFPIGLSGILRVEGDAVDEGASGGSGVVSCSPSGGVPHGIEGRGETIDLWIPANSRSTLHAAFDVAPTAPWPRTDYRPRFTVSSFRSEDPAVTATRPNGAEMPEQVLLPPELEVSGRRGTRIELHTTPESAERAGTTTPQIAAATSLRISGSTDPPHAHRTLLLRYIGPGTDRQLSDVAAVALDAHGRFDYSGWKPAAAGYHELWAFTSGFPDPFAPDYFCPRAFTVEGSAEAAAPGYDLRLLTRRARPRRRRVAVKLACSGPVAGACRATLTARRRGARLKRSIAVTSGSTRTVTIAIPRRFGRLPARLALTATNADTRARIVLR